MEAKLRLKMILERAQNPIVHEPRLLRKLRSVGVLERINTEESHSVLKRLAVGADNARLTQAASAALRRLN